MRELTIIWSTTLILMFLLGWLVDSIVAERKRQKTIDNMRAEFDKNYEAFTTDAANRFAAQRETIRLQSEMLKKNVLRNIALTGVNKKLSLIVKVSGEAIRGLKKEIKDLKKRK